jgi:hypothetical protein
MAQAVTVYKDSSGKTWRTERDAMCSDTAIELEAELKSSSGYKQDYWGMSSDWSVGELSRRLVEQDHTLATKIILLIQQHNKEKHNDD